MSMRGSQVKFLKGGGHTKNTSKEPPREAGKQNVATYLHQQCLVINLLKFFKKGGSNGEPGGEALAVHVDGH